MGLKVELVENWSVSGGLSLCVLTLELKKLVLGHWSCLESRFCALLVSSFNRCLTGARSASFLCTELERCKLESILVLLAVLTLLITVT